MKINSASEYYKKRFGTKVYRLSLSAASTCPNRDGKVSFGGCTFCSQGGSGDFAETDEDVLLQIEKAKKRVDAKFPSKIKSQDRKYIAYFQSFTNTYGPLDKLEKIFTTAASQKEICALSIGTRPDCLGPEVLEMLKKVNSIKPVTVELGLQTIHQKTADAVNRGYDLKVFEKAYKDLKDINIEVIVHVILGLPGEGEKEMLETISYLSHLRPVLDGIKIQLLQVLEGTVMGEGFKKNPFKIYSMEEYCSLVIKCLKLLPQETVIHRMTGDGPKRILIEPAWSGDKKRVLNYLNKLIARS